MQPLTAGHDAPELSVVIVTWNSGQTLLECLRSLAASPPSAEWEAIVVDNASTDGSIDAVRTELPWVRVIENSRNRGLAAANNQGIVASTAPFVLISNPDVMYRDGAIDALRDVLARRPRAAFAAANLRYPDGGLQTSVGALPSIAEALLGRRLSRYRPRRRSSRMWWYGWGHDEERPVGHAAEACYLIRRTAVAEIGLQDERFELDWEGLEWSRRAWQAGWEVWFCPSATVIHLEAVSRNQVPRRRILFAHRGMYLYLRQSVQPAFRPLLAAAVLVRMAANLAANALTKRAAARMRHRRA